ncbi:MAG: hypothetical protein L0Z73_02250 [Gammaproteobacteria bacterium]|nr:hypothetical protein [Gammaproteobacteria bacterium]
MVDATKTYEGIHNDYYGGMTPTGSIIKDAWLFELLPEEETCEGWTAAQMQTLYERVYAAWEPYGHMVSLLPDELQQRHQRIHDAAVTRARELGWDPDLSDET